jgi:hypothetical protein
MERPHDTRESHWPDISEQDHESLRELADLLHLFHYRNKNQHRHSVWWRAFSVFRQQFNHLLGDIAFLIDVPATHLARVKKKAQDAKYRARIQQRTAMWQEVLIQKWQQAFSQLVADGRFAVLGIVLIAALAQICMVTGITADIEQLGQMEVEKVLAEFAKEDWGLGTGLNPVAGAEDIGQLVTREEVRPVHPRQSTNIDSKANVFGHKSTPKAGSALYEKQSHSPAPMSKPRKRRKKGDAIDDLFSGLL